MTLLAHTCILCIHNMLCECSTRPIIHAGLLEAPTNVSVDVMDEQSVNASWSPPLTLDYMCVSLCAHFPVHIAIIFSYRFAVS